MKAHRFLISHPWRHARRIALAAALLLRVGTVGASDASDAGAKAPEDAKIRVGLFASLTGIHAAFGNPTRNGIQLAVDDANREGGVNGRQLQLLIEDDASKAGEAATAAEKLISRDKVVGLLGEVVSSRSLEAAPIAQRYGVPMISSATTSEKLTQVGDCIFRVCYTDPFQGEVISKFALSRGYKKVAILTDARSEYSLGLSRTFIRHFTTHGGTMGQNLKYSGGEKDFRAQLTTIKFAGCDAIFVPGYYSDAGLIALQARQLGIQVPLLGGDGWDSEQLVEIGGRAIEGSFFSTHFSDEDPSPVVQNFLARYRERFGNSGGVASALAYDSARLLIDAIRRAGSDDKAKIRDALAATKGFAGVTGTISIDDARNAVKPVVIVRVQDRRFRYVTTITP